MAIDCDAALARMMEAEPAELAGEADTELTAHLSACPRCALVAARLLEGQVELDRALSALSPRIGAEEALVRARGGRLRRSAWRVALPLAAAAALAGILFLRPTPFERLPRSDVPAVQRWEERPFVEPQTNQSVLVFETRDRSAKVIWFY
jgi:anti-sigma factor RsiW